MILLNRIISLLKNEEFNLDKRIPNSYLFLFFLSRLTRLFIGCFKFMTIKRVFVHSSAIIKSKNNIKFGSNLSIDRHCYIDALSVDGIKFGDNVSIGKYTIIECTGSLKEIGKGMIVGNNVGLGIKCNYGCAGGVIIGDDTIIGSYVSFHSENHIFNDIQIPIRKQGVTHKGITIGNNCWIGAKTTFLDGSFLGSGCVVAAGSIVRGVFPDNVVIAGVPAKIIKHRN